MRWTVATLIVALSCACTSPSASSSSLIASWREVGTIPNPPGAGGRDVGFSVSWGGHSVWVFGDTFFSTAASDGYHWRASTWSWTDDTDASDGLSAWTHALGSDNAPLQQLPHTPDEQMFDDAHNGTPCPASTDCGARHTIWPDAVVADPERGRVLVFDSEEHTEPSGAYAFTAQGSSIAVWTMISSPGTRPAVRPELSDPTVLFPVGEPTMGAAALADGETLYAYSCPGGGLSSPCIVGSVPLANALQRSAWQFWNGTQWVADWHAAVQVFDGAPLLTVHFSEYLGRFVAFYMVPLGTTMAVRTAPRPEGPWSDPENFGSAQPAQDGNWDYALAAHHEFAAGGGRIEYLSYFQPGTFLNGTVRLLEVTLR